MPRKKIKKVFVSLPEQIQTKLEHKQGRFIESFYPIDKHDCDCSTLKTEMINKLSSMSPTHQLAFKEKMGKIVCPKGDKLGFKKFKVICNNCKALIANVRASDKTLKDFCDLHYVCQHDGHYWKGCMTVNISPYTGQLGFECTCGQDTRDFSEKDPVKEQENKKGRLFNQKDSKFKVVVVH